MAQFWVSTPTKRLMLAGLRLLGRATRPRLGGRERPIDRTRPVRRILVVELWNIGDVVLMMPFLAQLRALFPGAEVALLAQPHAKVLLEGTNLVDEVLETQLTWTDVSPDKSFAYDWRALQLVRRQLREREFDIAFQCRMHIREHLILALSRARRRVGYAFPGGDGVLTDAIPVDDPGRHKTADWLQLLAPFGVAGEPDAPALSISPKERAWASRYLRSHGAVPSDVVIGVHPGASNEAKRWPLERFQQVTTELAARPEVRIVAFVEPGGYGASLGDIPGVILAKVGLRELIALIGRCHVLVGNDSGPMHIAGVLGVPVAAIFASGIKAMFSPLGAGHELVSPEAGEPLSDQPDALANSQLLKHIPVAHVVAAVDRVLQRNQGSRPWAGPHC